MCQSSEAQVSFRIVASLIASKDLVQSGVMVTLPNNACLSYGGLKTLVFGTTGNHTSNLQRRFSIQISAIDAIATRS